MCAAAAQIVGISSTGCVPIVSISSTSCVQIICMGSTHGVHQEHELDQKAEEILEEAEEFEAFVKTPSFSKLFETEQKIRPRMCMSVKKLLRTTLHAFFTQSGLHRAFWRYHEDWARLQMAEQGAEGAMAARAKVSVHAYVCVHVHTCVCVCVCVCT